MVGNRLFSICLLRRSCCQPKPAERAKNLTSAARFLSLRSWTLKQRLDLWDALPVARMLICRHLIVDAPNKLLYVNLLDSNGLTINEFVLSVVPLELLLRGMLVSDRYAHKHT